MVQVVTSGKTRDKFLGDCIRNIWWICAHYDIMLQIEHIQGVRNDKADALSRLYSSDPINPALINHLCHSREWQYVSDHHFNLTLGL